MRHERCIKCAQPSLQQQLTCDWLWPSQRCALQHKRLTWVAKSVLLAYDQGSVRAQGSARLPAGRRGPVAGLHCAGPVRAPQRCRRAGSPHRVDGGAAAGGGHARRTVRRASPRFDIVRRRAGLRAARRCRRFLHIPHSPCGARPGTWQRAARRCRRFLHTPHSPRGVRRGSWQRAARRCRRFLHTPHSPWSVRRGYWQRATRRCRRSA